MTEINRDEVYENCAKIDELVSFLKNYNFELVEQSWEGITWGDGFFIKKQIHSVKHKTKSYPKQIPS